MKNQQLLNYLAVAYMSFAYLDIYIYLNILCSYVLLNSDYICYKIDVDLLLFGLHETPFILASSCNILIPSRHL